jgi:beta-glucosidase/6-phospho-beta-glucosidase/beta-galactosidase
LGKRYRSRVFCGICQTIGDSPERLGEFWITINEPDVYVTSGYINGAFPPGKKDMAAAFHVMCNLLKGHAVAFQVIHAIQLKRRWVTPSITAASNRLMPGSAGCVGHSL